MKLIIRLDEEDLKCLIGGGGLTINIPDEPQAVTIYMANIGFYVLQKIMEEVDIGKRKVYQDFERINQSGWEGVFNSEK